jgi:hypothetical protein
MFRMSDSSPPYASSEPQSAPPVQPLVEAAPLAPAPVLTPEQQAATARLKVRVWCAFVFAICAVMLGIALWLKPSSHGIETHTQLGLMPCGFFRITGMPCPTCGCTTAVSHFAHGNLAMSLFTQPFGFYVALVATLMIPLTAVGIVTGRWKGPSMFWLSWYWRAWVFGSILILVASWLYKIWLIKSGLSG